jgi:hypothetical protein
MVLIQLLLPMGVAAVGDMAPLAPDEARTGYPCLGSSSYALPAGAVRSPV